MKAFLCSCAFFFGKPPAGKIYASASLSFEVVGGEGVRWRLIKLMNA